MRKGLFKNTSCLLLILASIPFHGIAADQQTIPTISIIIDDIGYRQVDDTNALNLPGPITYAILPHSPYAEKMSLMAHSSGKEIILHLPMEAIENTKNHLMGPGGLELGMDRIQFIATLGKSFRSIPNIIGVNNHMGSLLTMDRERMGWLMDYLNTRNVFYVDSLTSHNSVATIMAGKKNVPYMKRDVFLDNEKNSDYINAQFDELLKIARRKGTAIAIGHPHPETLSVLQDRLGDLHEHCVRLIGLQEMLEQRHTKQTKLRKMAQY